LRPGTAPCPHRTHHQRTRIYISPLSLDSAALALPERALAATTLNARGNTDKQGVFCALELSSYSGHQRIGQNNPPSFPGCSRNKARRRSSTIHATHLAKNLDDAWTFRTEGQPFLFSGRFGSISRSGSTVLLRCRMVLTRVPLRHRLRNT